MDDDNSILPPPKRTPWNKGKLIGAKPPLLARHVWSIRTKLQIERRARELAMFNLAIDSKLRGCDVVAMRGRRRCPKRIPARPCDGAPEKDQRPVRADVGRYGHTKPTASVGRAGRSNIERMLCSSQRARQTRGCGQSPARLPTKKKPLVVKRPSCPFREECPMRGQR
jgi:hypothetical protein